MAAEKMDKDIEKSITGKDLSKIKMDNISISPEVISKVAGITASKVPGIAGMSVGLVGGIAEKLGQRDLTKGIKVQQVDDEITLDLNIIVEYGAKIPDVAEKLQDSVRRAVEETTGFNVTAVNIHVHGIQLPKEKEEKPAGRED